MESKIDLIYRLNGPAIDTGIDVFQLSPLLLSLGKLIQQSQEIVSPGGKKLGVNIEPFQKGSFIIELAVFAQNNFQQILDTLNSSNVQEVKNLLEWIGIIGGGTTGVIQLYKYLKGKPKRIEEVGPDQIMFTTQEDNSIIVDKKVYSLYKNFNIQQSINDVYGNFLGQEGIETVESYLKGTERQEDKVIVTKDLVPYFNPENTIPSDENQNEQRNITRAYLKPKRVSLEGEPNNWSLRKGSDIILTATIRDNDFLNKVRLGEIRLAKEDLLEVDLLEIQTLRGTEVETRYEVNRVINYTKAPVQSELC